MRENYIILENTGPGNFTPLAGGPGIVTPLGAAMGGPGLITPLGAANMANQPMPRARVTVERLSTTEAARAHRDGVTLAPSMPTRLVEPVGDPKPASMDDATDVASWGLNWVSSSAWTGTGIKSAVLDTGIDRGHKAFHGKNIVEKDFSGDGNGDRQGHGTHVTGTAFGNPVGGKAIGVAPGVSDILIGKVLDDNGRGSSQMMFEGIRWALSEGAKVINMSLGFDFPGMVDKMVAEDWPAGLATSRALVAYRMNADMFAALIAMSEASVPFDGGCIIIAAAGNESKRNINPDYEISVSLPAETKGIVSVGALQEGANGLITAWFSNTGPTLSAPGVGVVSAKANTQDDLVTMNGTSMASPHVAGAAALWWQRINEQRNVPATAPMVLADLIGDATTAGLDPFGDPADRGKGIVQAPV
jgi:subtilisin family serine protease